MSIPDLFYGTENPLGSGQIWPRIAATIELSDLELQRDAFPYLPDQVASGSVRVQHSVRFSQRFTLGVSGVAFEARCFDCYI